MNLASSDTDTEAIQRNIPGGSLALNADGRACRQAYAPKSQNFQTPADFDRNGEQGVEARLNAAFRPDGVRDSIQYFDRLGIIGAAFDHRLRRQAP
jgi:hypothetical protein